VDKVGELANTGGQVTTSLHVSSTAAGAGTADVSDLSTGYSGIGQCSISTAAGSGGGGCGGGGGDLLTGYSSIGHHSMSTTAATSSSMTSVSDTIGHSSWSSGQSASIQHLQRAGGACEAATIAQQMIYRHEASSEQHTGDKLEFEDGLRHLWSLYETQLNVSSRSANTVSTIIIVIIIITIMHNTHTTVLRLCGICPGKPG